MPTWYATGAGNINSVGRFNSLPNGTGTTLTWPPASGDILVANGRVITVNVSVDLGSGFLRADLFGGATSAAGYFSAAAGVSITANLAGVGDYGYVLRNATGGTVYLVGDITGPVNTNYFTVYNQSSTLQVTGTVNGGAATNSYGIENATGGTVNVTGTVNGSSASNAIGIRNSGTGTVNLTGTANGGSNATADGIRNASTGTVTVTGNAIAATAPGVRNQAGGTLTLTGYAQASTTQAGAINDAQGVLTVGETRSASNGLGAVSGAFRYASATAAKDIAYAADAQMSMTVINVAATVPAVGDVRKNVIYGDGAYIGTLNLGNRNTSMLGRF